MLVELIVGNYAISNGLVNDVDGIFRFYTKGEHDIVWIEFVNPAIGILQRASMHHLFTPEIASTWTPITRVCRNI